MRPHATPRQSRIRTVSALGALTLTAGLVGTVPSPASARVDPIDGPQTSGDVLFPNIGNGGYDVSHYDLDLTWNPTGVVSGVMGGTVDAVTTIDAATTGAPLQSFSLDFRHPTMTISSLTVDGVDTPYTSIQSDDDLKYKLVVTPAVPVEGEFTVEVEYSGVPVRQVDPDGSSEGWMATADGATFLNQPIGAMTLYPNNNTPADKATYDVSIDIPNTITSASGEGPAAAAGNGELTKVAGDGRTDWQWSQTEPMATELVMISIGKYDVLESDVVLDSGRTLHEWSFVDSGFTSGTKTAIDAQRARWKSVLDGLESIYGPYPGHSIGVVVDTTPNVNYALETQDRSYFNNSIAAGTFVHEAAHQWYGNNVSPTEWNDLWINEGMATWVPTWFNNEGVTPPTSATTTGGSNFLTWNSTAATSPAWTIPPAGMTDPADLYDFQSYTRGSMMWEALRQSIGDADFFELLRDWQARYAGESHGGADLEALAEEISGRDLTAFFVDWTKDADRPAWPQRYDLLLDDEASSDPLAPGETVTYTLTATNVGFVPLTSSVAEVDLADVLDDATLDESSLPAGLALEDDTLVWTLPTTARRAVRTVSFDVEVDDAASDADLTALLDSRTLGGLCATGSTCTSTLAVPEQPVLGTPDPVLEGGPARVGRTLTVDPGFWSGSTDVQWFRNTQPIAGVTELTYTLVAADLGKDVVARVTYGETGYSAITKNVVAEDVARGVMTRRPVPRITGRARVGALLTAVPGAHDAGVRVRYQWLANGNNVRGATGRTFRIPPRLKGTTIRVRTTATKPGYVAVARVSRPTARVS